MDNKNLISIIVPIYGVEQYLKRCVDSLVNQTYRNLEIILVDDGSPDKCGEICDEYAKKDERIVVIHKPNGGLADARNSGIKSATGEYLMFIDSDDWIELDTCEIIINEAILHKAEIVVFEFNLVYDNGKKVKRHSGIVSTTPTKEECIRSLIYKIPESGIFNNVCNKLFARRLFADIRFPCGKVAEDHGVIYKLIHNAETVCVVDRCFYNYYKRDGSISFNEFYPKIINDRFDFAVERLNFLEKFYPQLVKYQIARMLGDAYISLAILNNNDNCSSLKESISNFAKKYSNQEKSYVKFSRRISLHYYCYPLFWLYVNLFIKKR